VELRGQLVELNRRNERWRKKRAASYISKISPAVRQERLDLIQYLARLAYYDGMAEAASSRDKSHRQSLSKNLDFTFENGIWINHRGHAVFKSSYI
jgi:hypothetical protein